MVLRKFLTALAVVLVLGIGILLVVGDYVYRTGTAVLCGIHPYHLGNTPARFETASQGNGSFKGSGWDRWVGHDISRWWIPNIPVEEVRIRDPERPVTIAGWWITPTSGNSKATVIVAHGINSSRHNFDTLMPATMLAQAGFNVLLIDLRDQGDTTCEDSRHSAGQDESDDIVTAAYWLKSAKAIPMSQIGVHGVSGGALAAMITAAKNPEIAAFSLEAPIFDFNKAATHEVEYQGFPGFLWRAAYWAARVRGTDLMALTPSDGIKRMGERPLQVLHGSADSRVPYHNATDLVTFARAIGKSVTLHTFADADHTEGLLLEPDRYYQELEQFFSGALRY